MFTEHLKAIRIWKKNKTQLWMQTKLTFCALIIFINSFNLTCDVLLNINQLLSFLCQWSTIMVIIYSSSIKTTLPQHNIVESQKTDWFHQGWIPRRYTVEEIKTAIRKYTFDIWCDFIIVKQTINCLTHKKC